MREFKATAGWREPSWPWEGEWRLVLTLEVSDPTETYRANDRYLDVTDLFVSQGVQVTSEMQGMILAAAPKTVRLEWAPGVSVDGRLVRRQVLAADDFWAWVERVAMMSERATACSVSDLPALPDVKAVPPHAGKRSQLADRTAAKPAAYRPVAA